MLEYKPPKDRLAAAVMWGLFILAVAFLILGALAESYGGLWRTAGVICAVGGLLIGTRFVMTEYVYAIEYTDGRPREAGPDLVITEVRGKHRQVVCRVALIGSQMEKHGKAGASPRKENTEKAAGNGPDAADGELTESALYPRGTALPGEEHNYAASLFPTDGEYWFFPTRADGGGRILFSPNEELVQVIEKWQ